MFNEIFQLFREFEKYDSTHGFRSKYKDQLPPASKDFETYIQAKEDFDKPQRFIEFLQQRRNLLDATMQSVIDNSSEAIKTMVEQALNDETRKTINKTVKWYFK